MSETGNWDIPAEIAGALLDHYGTSIERRIFGGLSAAIVWKCVGPKGSACLRRWPAEHPSEAGLRFIHSALLEAERTRLTFIPRILKSNSGDSFRFAEGHLWELTQWMPGIADYWQFRSRARFTDAVRALADLHTCWRAWRPQRGKSASIERRACLLELWLSQTVSVDRIVRLTESSEVERLTFETCRALQALAPKLIREVGPHRNRTMELQPVLRDVWNDHILFDGDQVTGIIDYGAMSIDTPASDLARLLGSLEPDDAAMRNLGFQLYCDRIGHPGFEWHQVDLLDRAGTLLSAAQWMDWLVIQRRQFPMERSKLLERWRGLLGRAQTVCS